MPARRKFVVLSQQRSGSHMLLSLLNSHSQILCNSDLSTAEIKANGEDWAYAQGFRVPPLFPDRVYFPAGKQPDTVGFLLKTKTGLQKTIRNRIGLKIIYLERTNYLAVLLSRKISESLGCYDTPHLNVPLKHARSRRSDFPPVSIDSDDAAKFFADCERESGDVREDLAGTDHIAVTYDELTRDTAQTMQRVFEFLGVPPTIARFTDGWGAEKLDGRPMSAAIANYQSLQKDFVATRWAKFFS
jgi:hypothetical protein